MNIPNDQFLSRADLLAFWHGRPIERFSADLIIEEIKAVTRMRCGANGDLYEPTLLRALAAKEKGMEFTYKLAFRAALRKRGISTDAAALRRAECFERKWVLKQLAAQH
ncbi:hypothetical protein [Pseudomonas sp. Marseille-Q5115]|uniref:hypothetical protein n=1 Tax=Pseudomonas sp. Marseille-Q5115 TaxID=2866593 RepID=UPI001CE4311A|nr:hypothetical protein [Pseudomonas sp. Marseille-Q5115]